MTIPHDSAGHPDALLFTALISGLLYVGRHVHEWLYPPETPRRRYVGPGPKPR